MRGKSLTFVLGISIGLVAILISIFFVISFIPSIDKYSQEHWKLYVSFTGPILAFIAFVRTIQVQVNLNKKEDKNMVRTDFYDLLKLMNDYKSDIGEVINNVADNVESNYMSLNEFPRLDVYAKLKKSFNEIGPFFRTFHRILKNLNIAYEDGVINHKEYRSYVGTLRTQFNSHELEFILYNSVLMPRGLGLGIELVGTSFFGDKVDILINQHLNYQKYFQNELLDMFIDHDSNIFFKKHRANERKNMRKIHRDIVDIINSHTDEKTRVILVNRLTSSHLQGIKNFDLKVTDEEKENINY